MPPYPPSRPRHSVAAFRHSIARFPRAHHPARPSCDARETCLRACRRSNRRPALRNHLRRLCFPRPRLPPRAYRSCPLLCLPSCVCLPRDRRLSLAFRRHGRRARRPRRYRRRGPPVQFRMRLSEGGDPPPHRQRQRGSNSSVARSVKQSFEGRVIRTGISESCMKKADRLFVPSVIRRLVRNRIC